MNANANFNPRSRMGSDLMATTLNELREFQSTLPHGERPANNGSTSSWPNFNPRSRMGSDPGQRGGQQPDLSISIHAPAWGATDWGTALGLLEQISIHAPAWGATSILARDQRGCGLFQSTLPHGERHWYAACERSYHGISIHAPAWGATATSVSATSTTANFNPRSRIVFV